MTTLAHTHESAAKKEPGFFQKCFSQFLTNQLSYRLKRMIFLSSALGLIENINNPDNEMLIKLNKVLRLAHDKNAIKFPMAIHSWLWKRRINDQFITVDGKQILYRDLIDSANAEAIDFSKVAKSLIDIAPPWTVYSRLPTIAKDLEVMFKNVHQLRKGN